MAALEIDVVIESPLWAEQPQAERIVHEAIIAAAKRAGRDDGEVAVLLADDSTLRDLNRRWRGQDKPTNVLSFPASDGATLPQLSGQFAPHLGDIAIAFETLAREAEGEGKSFAHHLAHLSIHGYLHLLGYDHITEQEASVMEQLETALLATLGIPDPYIHTSTESPT
jgi:probable rRNA maturation factor